MRLPDWSPIRALPAQTLTDLFAKDSGRVATLSADVASTMKDSDDLTVLSGLQANHREIQITTKGDPKPWHDIRVRQAITHAIDRQDIIDKVYAGGINPVPIGSQPGDGEPKLPVTIETATIN